jgi:DNA-binding response OmpR family regulator
MPLSIARWVFQSNQERTQEENERWWQECYTPSPIDAVLQSQPRWQIIVGGAGSGKSTVLTALERQMCKRALILRYSPEFFPNAKQVLKRGDNHLSQLMALAGLTIRRTTSITLDRVMALSHFQREYLRWLMDKFGGPRAYTRWVQTLGGSEDDPQLMVPFQDLYATQTEHLDVDGQIADLVALVRRWGYTHILTLIDTETITQEQLSDLGDLFDWQELWQHEGFGLMIAVTPAILEQADLIKRGRGRSSVTRLNWTRAQVCAVANRHLAVATNRQIQSLEQLAKPSLLEELHAKIEAEYGAPTPQGAVALAQVLVDFASRTTYPLGQSNGSEVYRAFMGQFMPLRIDKHSAHRGVWRGPRFIPLDDKPFRLLEVLIQKKGIAISSGDLGNAIGLEKNEAKSKVANVHTVVRRVREAIEPDPSSPVYLHNRRDEGYWVEHCTSD